MLGNSYMCQFITNNHDSFQLWWEENLFNCQRVSKFYEHDFRLVSQELNCMMLSEFWCTVLVCAMVPQAILESSANMFNSATSEFELKFIQRGGFSNESFITFSLQILHSRRRLSGILVSQFNPLLHNSGIINFILQWLDLWVPKDRKLNLLHLKHHFLFLARLCLRLWT